ncbi:MAG: Ig-like domain-containing protein [Cyanobacteria bacterium]|nr:Ig-like domain-containing protein [Cyanobacteriota bacterium]
MVLVAISALLILLGDHSTVRVQSFSWQSSTVGAENTALVLTFNRPMDPDSISADGNLRLTPPLPGRISWAGRRLVYTLDGPAPYGESFTLSLTEARDRLAKPGSNNFEPFLGNFESRDRAFAYIGTEGDEQGRLVLVNLSQKGAQTLLTPANLTVLDFEPYPLGDRLLFSAIPTQDALTGVLDPTLYTVTTGLLPRPPQDPIAIQQAPAAPSNAAPGTITEVLSGGEYQLLAFDLAPNGRILVVQRVNKSDPNDFGAWVLSEDQDLHRLSTEPGGEFLIAPDSETLLMLQGQGTAIIPLNAATTGEAEQLDFLPEFGRVFDLSSDGTTAAMVDFNQNNPDRRFTESLVLVNNQGEETEVLNVDGGISDAQFDPTNQIVYALASRVLPGEDYQEQPFLAAVNLDSQTMVELLTLPPQTQATMAVAPDGLALLFTTIDLSSNAATGEPIWLLPLFTTTADRFAAKPTPTTPQPLPYQGLQPTWLP